MKSFPFDSQVSGYDDNGLAIYDRAANSDILAAMLDRFFASGIVPDNDGNIGFFVGESSTALQTIVNPGYVIIKGRCGWEEDVQIMTHNAPDATYDRIDRIVLRKSTEINERQVSMVLLTGTPATSPVAPALTRNNSVWEIAIADILIKKNISTISQANISDIRLNTELCGISEVPLQVFNTTQLYSQIQTDLAEFKANEQASFLAWVESLQEVLDDETAGNLLNMINVNSSSIKRLEDASPTNEQPLSISQGGTGATTAAAARTNLGITPANIGAVSMKTATASLPVNGWSNNQQTVSVNGVTANNTVIVTAAPASYEHYNECAVRCSAQAAGKLTFTCTDKPTAALTANVLILT